MLRGLISTIVLFFGMILYFRIKNRIKENHPTQCSFCGKKYPDVHRLANGNICTYCIEVPYGGRKVSLYEIVTGRNHLRIKVNDMQNYINHVKEIGSVISSFKVTRTCPSGALLFDDNLGLFKYRSEDFGDYAHRISDIKSFKLVIDRNWTDPSYESAAPIEGGHIDIYLNELLDKVQISYDLQSNKFIVMKHDVKKVAEDDLRFLEELTGKRRS